MSDAHPNLPIFTLTVAHGTATVTATPREWAGACELLLPMEAVAELTEALPHKASDAVFAAVVGQEDEAVWVRARDVAGLVGATDKDKAWWSSAPDAAKAVVQLCRVASSLGPCDERGTPFYDLRAAHWRRLLDKGKAMAVAGDGHERILSAIRIDNVRELAVLRLNDNEVERLMHHAFTCAGIGS